MPSHTHRTTKPFDASQLTPEKFTNALEKAGLDCWVTEKGEMYFIPYGSSGGTNYPENWAVRNKDYYYKNNPDCDLYRSVNNIPETPMYDKESQLRTNLDIANKRILELQDEEKEVGMSRLHYYNQSYTQEIRQILNSIGVVLHLSTDCKFSITVKKKPDAKKLDLLLAEAQDKVRGSRQESYGDKVKNFTNIANLQAIMCGNPKTPQLVALEMICTKLARLIESPDHYDTLVDIIGYTMCYRDIRKHQNNEPYTNAQEAFESELESRK